jgi:hypothetical protein
MRTGAGLRGKGKGGGWLMAPCRRSLGRSPGRLVVSQLSMVTLGAFSGVAAGCDLSHAYRSPGTPCRGVRRTQAMGGAW